MSKWQRIDLFYHGYELAALDRPLGQFQSQMRLAARTAYRRLRRKQLYTGFYTAFCNLKHGLQLLGMSVHVNDFDHARRHPTKAIGMAGYPDIFKRVQLPNPAVFGPGYVPVAADVKRLTAHCNIKIFTQPSEWPCVFSRAMLGDRVQPMFVPVLLDNWPDLSQCPKTCDILIYDKIRWSRSTMVPRVLERTQQHLKARGLSSAVLRYGEHHLGEFRAALKGARAMIFLCEHETQGLAYQEAMASGLPILAWDEGKLVDPLELPLAPSGLLVSSVPYFDERSGLTFTEDDLEERFDQFWDARLTYAPRDYIAKMLSPERSARIYLDLLDQAEAMHA